MTYYNWDMHFPYLMLIRALRPDKVWKVATELTRVVPVAQAGADTLHALRGTIVWVGDGGPRYEAQLGSIAAAYSSLEGCCSAVANALYTYAEAQQAAKLAVAPVYSMADINKVKPIADHGRAIVSDAADACETVILAQIKALPKVTVLMENDQGTGYDDIPAVYAEAAKIPGFEALLNQDLALIYPGANTWQSTMPLQSPPPQQLSKAQLDALIAWARAHALNSAGDLGGKDNCTNFVSEALRAAGMRQTGPWHSDQDFVDDLAHHFGYGLGMSRDWALAGGLYDYLHSTGAARIPIADARPGDLVFFQTAADGNGPNPIEHSAVVTGIGPHGEILLSEHTSGKLDADLGARGGAFDDAHGHHIVQVIRLQPSNGFG